MSDDPYLVPALVRGLAALRAFSPERPEMTMSEIARALGITRSAAFRTVHTLAEEGYLLQVAGTPRYRVGPAVLRLSYGYHASRQLLEVAQPVLERLRDLTGWSTHLAVLDGSHILYLQRFASTSGLSSLVHVGSRLPAATTSMGRVLIAHCGEAALRRLYSDDPALFRRVLKQRERDLRGDTVASVGSFESGLCSVAAPVRDLAGEVVAAISAAKIADSVPRELRGKTAAAAAAISRALGFA